MISYKEAEKIIQKEFAKLTLETEQVDLLEAANRILAEDVYSDVNLPPFDNSAMDGYAIKFNDSIKKWKIIGEISAGNFNDFEVDEHSAISIMTGGKLPKECDTVIPIEDAELNGEFISLSEAARFAKGINTRKKGEDLLKGNISLPQNTLIKPHHIAVAASCGKPNLNVYKKLKIGVLATGDELVDIHETPAEDKLRCSNLYSLLSAIKTINMQPVNFGIAKDDKQLIQDRIKWALDSELEIFITTGGVSVGKFDFVKDIYEKLGVKINFWRAYIKPGKPILFGTYKNGEKITLVFGLPGNPVSCLVNFLIFVQENIYNLFNIKLNNKITAVLDEDIKKKDKKRHFMRGQLLLDKDGVYSVKRVGSQSSGNLAEMGKSNCLMIIEEERLSAGKGELVECIMI